MRYRYKIATIRNGMAAMGYNNTGLANAAGLSVDTVRNVLADRVTTPPTVAKIAKALGLDLPLLVVPQTKEGF